MANKLYVDLNGLSEFKTKLTEAYAANDEKTGFAVAKAGMATKLETARNFSITGDATASAVAFDGTGNVALSLAIGEGKITRAMLAEAVEAALAKGEAAKEVVDALYVNGVQVVKNGNKYEAVIDGADIALAAVTEPDTYSKPVAGDTVDEAIAKLTKGLDDVGGDALSVVEAGNGIAVTEKADHKQTISAVVKANDKVLANGADGLNTTLSFEYVDADRKIYLKGINGAQIGAVDCNAFIKDGMLYDQVVATATAASMEVTFPGHGDKHTYTDLTAGRTYIFLEFNNDGDKTYDKLDATKLVDVYTAGDGLQLDDHEFSVKMDGTSAYLSVGADGVAFDDDAVESMVDTKIAALDVTDLKSTGGAKVELTLNEVDGKVTSLVVAETDIASAAGLAAEIERAEGAEGDLADRLDIIEGADTVDGSIKKALKDAKAYADGLDTAMDTRVDALEADTHTHDNKAVLDGITSAKVSNWDSAKTIADKLDGAVTVEGSVKKQIKDAVDAEATARDAAITAAVEGLDASESQAAGADGLALAIVEENGKITSISGSIAAHTYDAYGDAAQALDDAKDYADDLYADIDRVTEAQIDGLFN